ncbi:MAG: ATP-binding cassette domain-containing protein [Propionicimonas sp.]|nr:ATP-binding cassette domain-containing protein [Propionicimonas sp.]
MTARTDELLRAEDVSRHFPIRGPFGTRTGVLKAVDRVTLDIRRGETLALVGESGSGKTTLGRCLLQMEPVTSGRVRYEGVDLTALPPQRRRGYHRSMQVIYQDPFSSLNPHRTALQQVLEPLRVLTTDADPTGRALEALEQVGITGDAVHKYPRAFSGGQRQRIGIARAISVRPAFVMCDEPVSALDVSIQAQIVNLLTRLQGELGLTYLFISHDLSVVRHIATRVAVMYRGRLLELGDTEEVFADPRHPYTRSLLRAIPVADPRRARAAALRPSPGRPEFDWPEEPQPLVEVSPGHLVAT